MYGFVISDQYSTFMPFSFARSSIIAYIFSVAHVMSVGFSESLISPLSRSESSERLLMKFIRYSSFLRAFSRFSFKTAVLFMFSRIVSIHSMMRCIGGITSFAILDIKIFLALLAFSASSADR